MRTWIVRHTLADGRTEDTDAEEDGSGTFTFTAPEGATALSFWCKEPAGFRWNGGVSGGTVTTDAGRAG